MHASYIIYIKSTACTHKMNRSSVTGRADSFIFFTLVCGDTRCWEEYKNRIIRQHGRNKNKAETTTTSAVKRKKNLYKNKQFPKLRFVPFIPFIFVAFLPPSCVTLFSFLKTHQKTCGAS